MKIVNWLFLFLVLSASVVFSQENYIQHAVSKGETMSTIAKKYNVNEKSIIQLNPDSAKALKLNSILIIPTASNREKLATNPASETTPTTHDVLPKETLYSIAKTYKVSLKELYKINPHLQADGLKIGQQITIPRSGNSDLIFANSEKEIAVNNKNEASTQIIGQVKTESDSNGKKIQNKLLEFSNSQKTLIYTVLPKDTKYNIAKAHEISVEELNAANPNLHSEALQIGQKINIPTTSKDPNRVAQVNLASKNQDKKEFNKNLDSTNRTVSETVKVLSPETLKTDTNKIETSNTEKIKAEQVLIQPSSKIVETAKPSSNEFEYTIMPKDTKYNIAKAHGITLQELDAANPSLQSQALKIGQKIMIPLKGKLASQVAEVKEIIADHAKQVETKPVVHINSVDEDFQTDANKGVEYVVLAKQTKYSIARECGITVAQLNKANPILLTKEMKVGQKIIIPIKRYASKKEEQYVKIEPAADLAENNRDVKLDANKDYTVITHEVLRRETKFGIAQEYGLTVKELEEQNPNSRRRLSVGSFLTIRTLKEVNPKGATNENGVEGVALNIAVPRDESFIDQLIAAAAENIGIPYRSGGNSKNGFDCSGLMCYAFNAKDVKLPRSSIEMSTYGVVVTPEEAKKGDLIFFKTQGGRRINHVGLVVEVADGDIKFIHSSSSGVMISSTKESYYKKAFTQINHVL